MPEQLGKLVEITAGHHVPGREGVTQVVEAEVSNLRSFEQLMETLIRTLTPTCCSWLRRQNPIFSEDSRIPPDLLSKFGRHGHMTHCSFLQLCPHDDQSLVVENVSPLKAKDLPAPH